MDSSVIKNKNIRKKPTRHELEKKPIRPKIKHIKRTMSLIPFTNTGAAVVIWLATRPRTSSKLSNIPFTGASINPTKTVV